MNLLGLDSSTAACSGCVVRADGAVFERVPEPWRLHEPPAHSRELMPALVSAMEEAGLDWSELDAIAVGVGPGAFTGLRIGVATARGLAHAHGLPLRPVSSLAALAAGATAPADPLVLPLVDARRGEVFGALYQDGLPLWEPFVAAPEAVADRLAGARLSPLAMGDGSLRFSAVVETAGARVAPEDSPVHVVRALHVCRLAAALPDTPPETVVPHYLRAPDATPR